MGKRKTILVVDDISLMRVMLVKYVKSLGLKILQEELGVSSIQVVEAENGREALEQLEKHPVDVVFLDLMMPEMNGLAFLAAKQKEPRFAGIPVIVCSALGEKETVERARDLGACAYIMKPFTLKSVAEKYREALLLEKEREAAT